MSFANILLASVVFAGIFQALLLIISVGRKTSSDWVFRLRGLMSRVFRVKPIYLMIGLPIVALAEVFLIVKVSELRPEITTILFGFSVTMATFTTVSAVFDGKLKRFGATYRFLCLALAVTLGVGWIVQSNMLVNNITAIIAGIGLLIILPKMKPVIVSAATTGIVIYDILGVWVTGLIVTLALGLPIKPPAMIMIPVATSVVNGVVHNPTLGLGDFAFGLMIALVMLDYVKKKWLPVVLFFISIVAAYGIVVLTEAPVPATITIVPIMLFGLWVGVFKERKTKIEFAQVKLNG